MSKFNFDDFMIDNCDSFRVVDIDESQYNIYAVGDVHGCLDEMIIMISKCKTHAVNQNKEAIIYFLGDLIDRGPSFIGVIDEIFDDGNIHCLLGNHELNFYLEALGNKECRSKARRENHEKFKGYDQSTQDMIMKTIGDMPNAVFINNKYILSHSPIRNVETISDDVFSNVNGPQCCMTNTPVDMNLLEMNYEGIRFFHGHQHWNYKPIDQQFSDQAVYSNKVINLDSGCVYGNKLTAMCINTMESLEFDAMRVYHDENSKN